MPDIASELEFTDTVKILSFYICASADEALRAGEGLGVEDRPHEHVLALHDVDEGREEEGVAVVHLAVGDGVLHAQRRRQAVAVQPVPCAGSRSAKDPESDSNRK